MFCARCGEQIPDVSEICPLCGREATLKVDPPPPVPKPAAAYGQIHWPSEPETRFPPARNPELRGVGGWLLFFCISLTVLSPLLMFTRVWGSGFELESMFDLALTAFGVLAGAMVWHVHPRAFIFLWIYFGLTVGLLLLGIAGFFLGDEGQDNQVIIQLVRSLFSTIIWFLYFKQSDRVQATFGRNL